MEDSILPPAPEGSELLRWTEDGQRHEPGHSNVVTIVEPDERFALRVEVDDPVHGYLVRLYAVERDREEPIGQTVVDDRNLALKVAAEMAASAEDLLALTDDQDHGPPRVNKIEAEQRQLDAPDDFDGDDEEWAEALEEAYEDADAPRDKGTIVTKTIDGRGYYYLQWRDGDKVRSQYVAPASPSS